MSTITILLQNDPMDQFSVVKLSFQGYAEVEPNFYHKYSHKIRNTLKVLNDEGDFHEINCNKNYVFTLITGGLEQLKEFHHLPENVEVMFSYYGANLYAISMFRELTFPQTIPKFHSRNLDSAETFYFDVHIHPSDFKGTITALPRQFGDFLKQNFVEQVSCCTDKGDYKEFHVLIRNDYEYNVTLVQGWSDWCTFNEFEVGKIRFKFINSRYYHVFHVYQISTIASGSTSNRLM